MAPIKLQMGPIEWALVLTLSALWGGSFLFNALALEDLPPLTVVLGRVGFAAIALQIILHAMGYRFPPLAACWPFLVMGLLNNAIPFTAIVAGQTQISSGLASILNATTPLFAVTLAHFLTTDEKLTTLRIIGVVLGIIGVTIMIGPAALGGMNGALWGQIAILIASIAYSFASIFGKRFRGIPPIVIAAGQLTGSTLIMIPLVLVIDQPWTLPMPGAVAFGSVLLLALMSSALAYIIYFQILARAGATNLMLVTFIIPPMAVLAGVLVLNETVQTHELLGFAMIALGLAVIDGRLFRKRPQV